MAAEFYQGVKQAALELDVALWVSTVNLLFPVNLVI